MQQHDSQGKVEARNQRKAELERELFRHGFELLNEDNGTTYVRASTSGVSSAKEPLMLDYKRDVANFVQHGFGTAHDVCMHFVHRYAFRTQAWILPPQEM
jgi:hypothetical protein